MTSLASPVGVKVSSSAEPVDQRRGLPIVDPDRPSPSFILGHPSVDYRCRLGVDVAVQVEGNLIALRDDGSGIVRSREQAATL
jgi:hypothetical protein